MVPGQVHASCFRPTHGLVLCAMGQPLTSVSCLINDFQTTGCARGSYRTACSIPHPIRSPHAVMSLLPDAALFRSLYASSDVARDDIARLFAHFQSPKILSYQSRGTTPGIGTDMGVE